MREHKEVICSHGNVRLSKLGVVIPCVFCHREQGVRNIVREWIRNSVGPPPGGIERLIADAAEVYDGWRNLPIPDPVTPLSVTPSGSVTPKNPDK